MGIIDQMETSVRDLRRLLSMRLVSNKNRRSPKFRFRCAIRAVMSNLKWLQEDKLYEMTLEEAYRSAMRNKYNAIQYKIQLNIPKRLKGLMRAVATERTDKEKEIIYNVIGHLRNLQVYPAEVKKELLSSANYAYFPPNKLLCRQGDPPRATYFILSGKISVTVMAYDPVEMKMVSTCLRELGPSDSFGEWNILHQERWMNSYSSIGHVELLVIRNWIFSKIVNKFLNLQGSEVAHCLHNFKYFKHFNERDKRECSIIARIEVYAGYDMILGNGIGDPQLSYFVLAGECVVVYELKFEHRKRNGKDVRVLLDTTHDPPITHSSKLFNGIIDVPSMKTRWPVVGKLVTETLLDEIVENIPYEKLVCNTEKYKETMMCETNFMQIGVLKPGACFGLGESYDSTFILSSRTGGVRLMSVPREFLLERNNGNIWGLTKGYLLYHLPDINTILQNFLTRRKWNKLRTKQFESLVTDTMPPGVSACQVPYYTRLSEDLNHPFFVRKRREVKTICPPSEVTTEPERGAESLSDVHLRFT